jgi:hypothetical protein
VGNLLPDSLDFWDAAPGSPPAQISFSAGETSPSTASIWRLSFTGDLQEADQRLDRAAELLAESDLALDRIPAGIERMVQIARPAGGGIEFGVPDEGLLAPSEANLMAEIAWLNTGMGALSFEVEAGTAEDRLNTFENFKDSLNQLIHQITNFAWVETTLNGRMLARTAVSWTGDANTIWLQAGNPEEFNLHLRALSLALVSRVLIAAPGGAALALPLAWKFVRQTLDEIQSVRDLSNSQEKDTWQTS